MQPRLLVVDDESEMGRLFKRIFGTRFDVAAATSAGLALDIIERRDFDVILCDLRMPQVSGVEFYRRLGEVKPSLQERVVFFTGGFNAGAEQAFVDGLDNPLVFKPFDMDELEAKFDAVMNEAQRDVG